MKEKRFRFGLVTMLMGLVLAFILAPAVAFAQNYWDSLVGYTYISEDTTWPARKRVSGDAWLVVNPGVTLKIPYGLYVPNGSKLNISGGGTVIVGEELRGNDDYSGCAGLGGDNDFIYGGNHQNGGSVSIEEGATVYAYGAPHAAGIGGGVVDGVGGSANEVNIMEGSTVAAYGGVGAAGIGGGEGGSSVKITITDSSVTAFGGCSYDGTTITSHTAPGIGSGNGGAAFDGIYIYRSKVLAGADGDAASIGGGAGSVDGMVTIINSEVTAQGNCIGAAPNVSVPYQYTRVDIKYDDDYERLEDVFVASPNGYNGGVYLEKDFYNTELNGGTPVPNAVYMPRNENYQLLPGTLVPMPDECDLKAYTTDTNFTGSVTDVTLSPNKDVYYKGDWITATAPEVDGYAFAGWYEVTGIDSNGKVTSYGEQLSDQTEYRFTLESDSSIVAVYAQPTFRYVGLTIGRQIGLSFWLDLPEATGLDYGNSYVHFSIDDKAARTEDATLSNAQFDEENGLYYFTFDVTSIEMAEQVTATFHYSYAGEEKSIDTSCSVQDYIEAFDRASNPPDQKVIDLVHATADLGFYMYPYLARTNGWTPGVDYDEMAGSPYRTYGDEDLNEVETGLKAYGIKAALGDSGVKASVSASFDSLTAVNVFLSAPAGADLIAEAEYGETTYDAVKLPDGRWLVRVEGIRPQHLDETVTVNGICNDKPFSIEVSVLSLLNLGYGNADNLTKAAFASAYLDWQAAKALG